MLSTSHHSTLRKTRSRRQKSKIQNKHPTLLTKLDHRTATANLSLAHRFQDILNDLSRSWTRFLTYSVSELEPICHQLAMQHMPSTAPVIEYCPLVCVFCQSLIYEPITLYCGHTFCDQCMKDEQTLANMHCPRCPTDIQGQVQSPVKHANENSYEKNRFIKQLFERSEKLKRPCQIILLVRKGQTEYMHGNFQKAIDIYSRIIDEYDKNDHLALYNRAKAYSALQNYDQGLIDASHVISVKPKWIKGYLCHSEILFEMKHYAAALMSSLKALMIDPEDQIGKQIMARHLHAVLHNNDNNPSAATIDSELEHFNAERLFNEQQQRNRETTDTETSNSQLTLCKTSRPSDLCFCLLLDGQNFNSNDFECSICCSLMWFPVTTPCGHVFCRECLIRSVDNTQAKCPICKTSLQNFFPMLIQSHVNKTEIISKIIETFFPTEFNERRLIFEKENSQSTTIPALLANNSDNSELQSFEIPIFVCVLAFPHSSCPLHVFEPRYRLMMRRTLETQSRTFGMCTYDDQIDDFADIGTLLYIRGLVFTPDGRSVVDTVGQRRFRVTERGIRDGYNIARVELIRDQPIQPNEFDELFQLNREVYNRVRSWFDLLDPRKRTLIIQRLEAYPPCDDLVSESTDGPSWAWIMINLLPIDEALQYTALASQSFRVRIQLIRDAVDFLLNQQTHQQQQQQYQQDEEQQEEHQHQQQQEFQEQQQQEEQQEEQQPQETTPPMINENET